MDKWERNSYKGTISEDNGHRKWTGVGKLIGPRGPGREKKNDWNFKSELEEFFLKKSMIRKKPSFAERVRSPLVDLLHLKADSYTEELREHQNYVTAAQVRLNQVLPNLELGSEASFAQRHCWGRQKRQKKKLHAE